MAEQSGRRNPLWSRFGPAYQAVRRPCRLPGGSGATGSGHAVLFDNQVKQRFGKYRAQAIGIFSIMRR